MTTLTKIRPAVGGTTLSRVLAVVKLQFTNPWSILVMPWLILAVILLANIGVWWTIIAAAATDADRADIREGLQYSGAGTYIFVYMLVVAVQAINSYFPFALGFGVTRRNYYLGVSLTFVLISAMFTVGMSVLGAIEEATGGWGLGGHMFTAIYFGSNWGERAVIYFTVLMFFFFIGSSVAAIYVKYRATGMIFFWVGIVFALIGIAALITATESWGAVGAWFAANGLVGSYLWTYVLTAIAAISGYLVLRRTTPRN